MRDGFAQIEQHYLAGPWVLGEQFSVADIYLFVVAGPDQSLQLITYVRVDSMMAMDLVVLFEHLGTPEKELVTC